MSQLKKILVAYDGSPHSKEALNWALDLSLLSRAEVAVVKVFEGGLLYATADAGVVNFMAALDEMHRQDQILMAEAIAKGNSRGVAIKTKLLQGNVAREIISYAEQNNFDMIVAGTKGHGALDELLMGSVTRNLVSLAHVPVLVVKD